MTAPGSNFIPAPDSLTEGELIALLIWDEDEDADAALAPGIYQTCAGAWRREPDGRWRWWQDPDFDDGAPSREPWCSFCRRYHVGGDTCMGHHP